MERVGIGALNTLEELVIFNKRLKKKIDEYHIDEAREMLAVNIRCIEKIGYIIGIHAEAEEIAKLYLRFGRLCIDGAFLEKNIGKFAEVQDTFVEAIKYIYELIKMENTVCACCGSHAIFAPLPEYYDLQFQKYGCIPHISETLNKEEYFCPYCMAVDRDRLIISFLKKIDLPCMNVGIKILQIAPSAAIERWIINCCPNVDYESTDLYMENMTFKSDISDLYMVEDNTYDFFICSHVLEHVRDDRKAMEELRRILKPDGIGIFLVPIALDVVEIDEEWGLPPEENWKRFGQGDHCRTYSRKGMIERLEKAGFFVHPAGKDFFGEKLFLENAFTDTSTLYLLSEQYQDLERLMKCQEKKKDGGKSDKGLE